VRSDWDMKADQEKSNPGYAQKRMLEQIVALPATLYFPPHIVAQLNEICDTLGYAPKELVIESLKGQIESWEEFYQYVMIPREKPEDFVWPEDPMFCLAYVTAVHFITTFNLCAHDPIAFAELKEHAPAEWSFSSLGREEDDAADWWKELD
jgi:hypothetical protein